MLVKEFTQKYSNLISKFEKETGKNAIWNNNLSKNFKHWLNQKIKYKNGFICNDPDCVKFGQDFHSKRALSQHNNWYNRQRVEFVLECSPISEFFINFLYEHSYFSQNLLIGIHKDTVQPQVDEYDYTRKSLKSLINMHMRLKVLERVSRKSYKINKEELKQIYGDNYEIIKEKVSQHN